MSNDKKQLLNESTVRRFMGLAGIGALSDKFVDDKQLNEVDVPDADDNFNSLEEQPEPPLGEPPLDEPPLDEPALDEPPLGAEEDLEMDEEPVEDIDLTQDEADVLINLGKKLEGEAAGEEDLEGAEELGGVEDVEAMGPPPEEELPPPPGPMAESLVRELTSRVSNRIKKEYVVSEVMKRVARRLQ